jgi:hypothetical protein
MHGMIAHQEKYPFRVPAAEDIPVKNPAVAGQAE